MIIRETPKNKDDYIIINNSAMIMELAILEIHPKYMDDKNCYFVKSDKILKYLKEKDFEQWWN